MTEKNLAEKCQEWQRILGLQHWEIEVKVVRGVEINNNCGQNDYSFVDEKSLIRIKTSEDYHGYFPYDMEAVLVHELLHIVLDIPGETSGDKHEQAIDRIARALVKLKREK